MNNLKPAKFCPGCGHPIVLRFLYSVLKEMGLKKRRFWVWILVVHFWLGIYCLSIPFRHTMAVLLQQWLASNVLSRNQFVSVIPAMAAHTLLACRAFWAALRNDQVTVIVVNNTIYAMTGGQLAPTTMPGQKTDTSPSGNEQATVMGPELVRSLNAKAFVARAAVNDVAGLQSALRKAFEAQKGR